MSKKMIGLIFIVVGVVVAVVSLTADTLGIGGGGNKIGTVQLAVIGLGVLIAIIGVVVMFWKKKAAAPPAQPATPPSQPGNEPPA